MQQFDALTDVVGGSVSVVIHARQVGDEREQLARKLAPEHRGDEFFAGLALGLAGRRRRLPTVGAAAGAVALTRRR